MHWVILIIVLIVIINWRQKISSKQRIKYIENYFFHKGIRKNISQKHPQLTDEQLDTVFKALKDYFQNALRQIKK